MRSIQKFMSKITIRLAHNHWKHYILINAWLVMNVAKAIKDDPNNLKARHNNRCVSAHCSKKMHKILTNTEENRYPKRCCRKVIRFSRKSHTNLAKNQRNLIPTLKFSVTHMAACQNCWRANRIFSTRNWPIRTLAFTSINKEERKINNENTLRHLVIKNLGRIHHSDIFYYYSSFVYWFIYF